MIQLLVFLVVCVPLIILIIKGVQKWIKTAEVKEKIAEIKDEQEIEKIIAEANLDPKQIKKVRESITKFKKL